VMSGPLEWMSLSFASGLGVSSYWRLIKHFHSPAAVLTASRKELLQVPGIRERQIAGLFPQSDLLQRGQEELERLAVFGAVAVSYDCHEYPSILKQLVDPPPVLYVSGNKELLKGPAIAMVGSRTATAYGKRTAFSLARDLASFSVTVVSGLALGIDTESHTGVIAGGGLTVAVLGCGLDVVYPPQNRSLYRHIAQNGALVSEYPFGTRPEGFRFPARNRIIAGLSAGVVVVEAAKRSGSLITAQIALDYGREIFAVPGQVDSFKSEGAHWLLKQGAKLVQRVDDIVEELGVNCTRRFDEKNTSEIESDLDIDPDAVALLAHIDPYPQVRQSLIEKTGLVPARVSELLLFLELEGLIEMLPGDQLRRISAK
jgi:DNA processing protein